MGFYKINYSALVDMGKKKVGIEIVIHDDSGFVMASCSHISNAIFDANVVGIIAVYRDILLSKDCGMEPCILESDKK